MWVTIGEVWAIMIDATQAFPIWTKCTCTCNYIISSSTKYFTEPAKLSKVITFLAHTRHRWSRFRPRLTYLTHAVPTSSVVWSPLQIAGLDLTSNTRCSSARVLFSMDLPFGSSCSWNAFGPDAISRSKRSFPV